MFIDTHAHLYSEQFNQDQDQVIRRAQAAGIEKVFLPNIDLSSVENMLSLVKVYPNFCYAMMGLHPCSVVAGFHTELNAIYDRLIQEPIIAIGEIGIDLYWDKTTLPLQREAFRIQVKWAIDLNLPIVIHARDSYNEIFEELDKLNNKYLKGVFHCFSGSKQQAEKILEYGNFYLGLGGVLTFKNSGISRFIHELPLENIILETDAPYLSPVPFRGQRNESAYVRIVGEKMAELCAISIEEVGQITSSNAKKLFNL